MKKIICGIFLLLLTCGFVYSQNLNNYISELAKNEDVQVQTITRDMIKASVEAAKAMDPTGKLLEQIPPFMLRLDIIEILDLTNCKAEIKSDFLKRFNSQDDEEGYETLLVAQDGNDKVKIFSQKEGDITEEIIILAVDTDKEEIVLLKLQGSLEPADVQKIIEEPGQITG